MKICVAQIKPVKGDIDANISLHESFIHLANGADAIFFPELSLTGYEPSLAKDLAIEISDNRLEIFQNISNQKNMTIALGAPTKGDRGIMITMIIFQPDKQRLAYSKQHLHSDELPFFINGSAQVFINNNLQKIAPGICYETSLPAHWENAHQNGANIYVASVAKTAAGIERSSRLFADMAKKYSMTVLLSNSLGPADNFVSCGQSAVWNNKGELLAQLDDRHESALIYDTTTGEIIRITI